MAQTLTAAIASHHGAGQAAEPVVNVNNEWDPLQEIIVGRLEGMLVPAWEPDMLGCMYEDYFDFYKSRGGEQWPAAEIERAQEELDELIAILEGEGFEVIECPFWNFNNFGGSFHCATLDIRRRGTLQSYF